METIQTLALVMGVGWASGINLYAAVLVLGLMGSSGSVVLPPDLEILTDPLVMGSAGVMYTIEFFADKVPGIDTGWDVVNTFIRIPAGAVLAAGAVGNVSAPMELAALLLGGSLAATSHATKAGTRVLINTSPEPVTNWIASITEDVMVVAGIWAALNHPWVFIALFAVFIAAVIWLLPNLWRGIKRLFNFALHLGRRQPSKEALRP